ncbi:M20 family metallopeptidase [Desertimonas flava]|uniref:M20 family metallopeptidase n=1 Tax=Desertimonas flava TaxID=2064846 RepID=UPI000E356F9F
MVDDLRRLVEIESPSHDVPAVEVSAAAVAELLERVTGRSPRIVDSPVGPHVHWQGGGEPRVLLVGHHDTVFPLGALAERPFTVSDGRATGPGVFDMKAGIVLAAHAVAALDDPSGVEILISSDEEVGSGASRQLIEERALACGNVLVLEPSADGGALKTGRKGVGTFEISIDGRAAHAGLEPEKGVNALVEAAHQVLTVAGFAAPERGTTVTPTIATAGTAENVVPASARVKVDVRVAVMDEAARVEEAFAGLTPVDPAASVNVAGRVNRPPMDEAASVTLFATARAVAAELGFDIAGVAVGGGSDGNFTAAIGVPTLDGLGAIGGGAHADHEWVDVASLPRRAALISGLLRRLTA